MTYFLDVDVFLYAAGGDYPYRKPCQRTLRHVAEAELDATTSSPR